MGVVYARWGESRCPPESTLLYDGIIIHAASMLANLLCIPRDSANSTSQSDASTATPSSHITRMEPLLYANQMNVTDAIPCALCHVRTQSVSGLSTCPSGWTKQYGGYLMTFHELSTTDIANVYR